MRGAIFLLVCAPVGMLYQKTETLTPHSARAGTGARTHQVLERNLVGTLHIG